MIKRSKSEWLSLFEAHDRSGLPAAAFCREQKLCPKYFSLRKKQLRYDSLPKPGMKKPVKKVKNKLSSFIPTVVPTGFKESITLITGPVTLKVPLSVDACWLVDVIHGLR